MKSSNKALTFWVASAVLAWAAVEWGLVEMALRESHQYPGEMFVWFFPLILIPCLVGVTVVNFFKLRSTGQRALLAKYLTIYLPVAILAPISVWDRGWPWWLVAQMVSLPVMIGLPFLYEKRLKRMQGEEVSSSVQG